MSSPRDFQALGGETVYRGQLIDVRTERFRHRDGEEVTREIVRHRGAVGVVAKDSHRVWLVRQPREAVGQPDLLEIPAGRLDSDGEQPLATAQRELAEEIGRGAARWEPMLSYCQDPDRPDVVAPATQLSAGRPTPGAGADDHRTHPRGPAEIRRAGAGR